MSDECRSEEMGHIKGGIAIGFMWWEFHGLEISVEAVIEVQRSISVREHG